MIQNRKNRIMIAGFGSGDGKTTLTLALLSFFRKKFGSVSAFKCGPDYIDPLFHHAVLGEASKNLDPFFLDEEGMKESFAEAAGSDINIIEAAMGLYDGIGATSSCSAYDVAKRLSCPIVLCVDARGKGASLIPLIKGFMAADEKALIKGVILNRISAAFYEKIKPEIEGQCGIKVLGFLPVMKGCEFSSRHLGLNLEDIKDIADKIERVEKALCESFNEYAFMEIAASAVKNEISEQTKSDVENIFSVSEKNHGEKSLVIAVAYDEAFNFYYRDNLRLLEASGVKLIFFSPVKDEKLPENICGIILGGGYPEKSAKELSENKSMISSLREAVENGIPVHAECGGFLYLCNSLRTPEGEFKMCGIFEDDAFYAAKSVRFGYVHVRGKENSYNLKGHEFHHYDVENPGDYFEVKRASDGTKYSAYKRYKNVLAGFPHIFYGSDINFVKAFIKCATDYQETRASELMPGEK